jgi:hypothetical protein
MFGKPAGKSYMVDISVEGRTVLKITIKYWVF